MRSERREHWEGAWVKDVASAFGEGYVEEEDGDYEDEEGSEDDEPLEYGSGDELSDMEIHELSGNCDEASPCEDYLTLLRALMPLEVKPPCQEMFYLIDDSAGRLFESSIWEREKSKFGPEQEFSPVGLEHIAGATCLDDGGYNGHNICASEMKGCTTYQCLAFKKYHWTPESDDRVWEGTSEVFLTGVGDRFRVGIWNAPRFGQRDMGGIRRKLIRIAFLFVPPPPATTTFPFPDRNENRQQRHNSQRDAAMPFHPACFDIFTRLSLHHLGRIDIHGLISWRNIQFSGVDIMERGVFSSDPNVKSAAQQFWAHRTGDEYLAANPLYIPGLIPILESAVATDSSFSPRSSAFAPLPSQPLDQRGKTAKKDPFLTLPQEMRDHVVDYLDSKEIAALRLASRAFHDLPMSLWYTLLRREMPWLWEVYNEHTPNLWTAVEVVDLKREIKEREEYENYKAIRRHIVKEEIPEALEEWEKQQPKFVWMDAKEKAQRRAESVGRMLGREYTNWHLLYKEIKKAKLKGLRNRERIWGDVGSILEQISRLRKEGMIVD
jgi:hypothetical protein